MTNAGDYKNLTFEEVVESLEKAHDMVSDLCDGKRKWMMSIPAQPDHDPDLVIGLALHKAIAYIQENERARNQQKETIVKLQQTIKKRV